VPWSRIVLPAAAAAGPLLAALLRSLLPLLPLPSFAAPALRPRPLIGVIGAPARPRPNQPNRQWNETLGTLFPIYQFDITQICKIPFSGSLTLPFLKLIGKKLNTRDTGSGSCDAQGPNSGTSKNGPICLCRWVIVPPYRSGGIGQRVPAALLPLLLLIVVVLVLLENKESGESRVDSAKNMTGECGQWLREIKKNPRTNTELKIKKTVQGRRLPFPTPPPEGQSRIAVRCVSQEGESGIRRGERSGG